MANNYRVLIIEDEITINRLVSNYFKMNGYQVYSAMDGEEGIRLFNNNQIDVICLDVMMPKKSGFEVAKIIREYSNVPIIIMSALSDEEDILKGYTLKIDDYIVKPFNPKVLIAKIDNLLSRVNQTNNPTDRVTVGPLTIDILKHRVYINKNELILSKKEFDLLHYLAKNKGMICSRDLLLDAIWGLDNFVEDRIVDTYIKKLRKHLHQDAGLIQTVFGVGYRMDDTYEKA